MKIKITKKIEIEIKTVLVKAGVRYWEDSEVNGVEDVKGDLIPCRDGDYWCPFIDIDTGVILNWTKGVTANVHYKVCDNGSYYLKDAAGEIILSIERNYVPDIIPGEFGDYIIMTIDGDGKIKEWNNSASLEDFENED